MSDDATGDVQTGVWLDLGFFPLAFFLFLCTPRVEVDGVVRQLAWGRHFLPMAPGAHTIRIWFVYLGMPQCGLARIDVHLAKGDIAQVKYFMPPLVLVGGSISLIGDTGRPVHTPAAWLTDPAGRHQYRYWDGVRWTAMVADNGVQSSDPVSGALSSASG